MGNSMIIQGNKIKKLLANSEANIKNQLKGIKDRSVVSYYICDSYYENKLTKITGTTGDFIVDSKKMNKYNKDINDKILPFVNRYYKYGIEDFKQSIISFLFEDVTLHNGIFDIREESNGSERVYLKFNPKRQNEQKFCNCIVGGVTKLVFEKRNETHYIYLELDENYLNHLH